MMEKIISYIITAIITYPIALYMHSKMLGIKLELKNKNTYIGIIIFVFFNLLNYMYVDGFVRFLICSIILVISSNIIFRENITKVFSVVIFQQVIYFLSELIFFIVILKLNTDISTFKSGFGLIISNVIIDIFSILIYSLPFLKKFLKLAIVRVSKLNILYRYSILLIFVITLNVLLMSMYAEIGNRRLLIINMIFIFVYGIIIFHSIFEKRENIRFKEQNKLLIDNLNEYEKMLDYQRVSNHENKNQLLVIQGMIDKTNTKALEYLDEIIKEKREDDEGIYTSASIIPQGGLQGLVYQKMLKMKENNITINLKVERKVRKINLDNLPSKTNYDLCRAVGIIIDNAIEENLNLKEREILICMYILDEYLVIEVSNKCSVIPDMTRLDEKGYTTKSNGHGYGLSLLKEIVDSNKNIINERSINKDIFTQIIKIKK